jgi:type I restriction enzyme M protein
MAIKKSELYSSLWESCDQLRGGMDASQYKNYILILLFVKYVSDKYTGQRDALIDVPAGGGFADMVALKGDKEIGDKINKIIARLAEANDLKGVIDVADFNDSDKLGKGQEMQDRLSNLIAIFENPALDFSRNRAEGDDILGDAYEYLMRKFATESGKSKGQFYTPAEVSRVMAKVIGINSKTSPNQTIYDPTCGSGSLLLKAADETRNGITIYGQEMDNATRALARMNMILHNNPSAEIWQGNTLAAPHFTNAQGGLKTFDFAVANPPFSAKAWMNGFDPYHDVYGRFAEGVPPPKNGDYAFLLHILHSLKSTGKGAVILPHGVLFRGNAEADIRKNIITRGYIKAIIGLPANLFYGTGIPACIIVLDKENAANRTGIFMIDASKGFVKDGNKNRLRHQDIHKMVDVFTRQLEIPGYSRMVTREEIEDNDYNLNIPRYIDSIEPEDRHDIDAHLRGGIPTRDIDALDRYWDIFPSLKVELFTPAERPGYSHLKIDPAHLKATIYEHPEFVTYIQTITALFDSWQERTIPPLHALTVGSHPRELIQHIAEDLLHSFDGAALIDPYDVYQHLMTYWSETMQDDAYLIASEGWQGANKLRLIIEDKEKKSKEKPDFVINKLKYKADLIPPALVIARYFADDAGRIAQLQTEADTAGQTLEELREEHGGEGGLLESVIDDKGSISKSAITARLKEIKDDAEATDEIALLKRYQATLDKQVEANKRAKDAQTLLDSFVYEKYPKLSEDEIKQLVIMNKWLTALHDALQGELARVSQALTGRIRQLAERYATPLPELTERTDALRERVAARLQEMGFTWN